MLPPSLIQKHFRIVLVEPQDSLNIGSVARAMMNLGFSELHLVRPNEFSIERALITGRWAEQLIRQAHIHESLAAALSDVHDVIGFSSLERPNRGAPVPLPDWMKHHATTRPSKTALLFGREDTGLTSEAIEQCRVLVRIPSCAEYPAFNLAQSVLLVLYEISRQTWDGIEETTTEMPTWEQYSHLDRICVEVMEAAGFKHSKPGDPTAAAVKGMLRRIEMNEREMRIMLALFNRIRISLGR